jgi:outer membrane lipoprotein carrier protein
MVPERSTLKFALRGAAVALVTLGAASASGEGALDAYVRQVESSYRGVKSWKADFVQVYRAGDRERRESGTVILARSGKMRWEYRQPESKLFLADGKVTALYVPSEKQLQRSPEKNSDDYRAPFALLLTRVNLHRVFGKIEDAGPAVHAGDRVLGCFPKHPDAGFDEVKVELTPTLEVRRLVIRYSDRSVMEFTFDRIERNVSTPESMFTLTPPAGTEVIDQPTGAEP